MFSFFRFELWQKANKEKHHEKDEIRFGEKAQSASSTQQQGKPSKEKTENDRLVQERDMNITSLICRDKNLASFDQIFTFWMIRFLSHSKNAKKSDFQKLQILHFFLQISSILLFFIIFHVFFIKILFFYQNFNFVF